MTTTETENMRVGAFITIMSSYEDFVVTSDHIKAVELGYLVGEVTFVNRSAIRVWYPDYEVQFWVPIQGDLCPDIVVLTEQEAAHMRMAARIIETWIGSGRISEQEAAHMRMAASDIQHKVQAGAAWLDEAFPGWAQCVHLETLDLGKSDTCVLAQVTGLNYRTAIQIYLPPDAYHDEIEKATQYGFTATPIEDYNHWYIQASYAWKEAIWARR